MTKTDDEIMRDVRHELLCDSRLRGTIAGVEVHHGVVALTGTVGIYTQKLAAQEAAHRVSGVLDIANDL